MSSNSYSRVGFSDNSDSYQAGCEVARRAYGTDDPRHEWHLAILISTSRHDPARLRDGVLSVIGTSCVLIGGYGVGVITNTNLAYDGYQVGILLVSFSQNSKFDVLLARGLADNEAAIGRQLGVSIRQGDYDGDTSVILLYDSVNRLKGNFQMNMATHLLGGMKSELNTWPRLVGAGLVGDMQCCETFQWHGEEILQQSAMALVLFGAMRIDSTVMHGCKPASSYHRITKTDGNVVLEIDHVPALDKISELLGGEGSGKTWRDYSFFVTLGVNRGEKFARFDEGLYANRLCMGVDKERNGLVMFEPDLQPGVEVQLMRRDMDFSYIHEKVNSLLASLNGRKPVFAFYIDCAGRAASYSGFDVEEAEEVQKALGDIPLLGFYSGVEIGEVAGKPTPLDWTGVLAIASEGYPSSSSENLQVNRVEVPATIVEGLEHTTQDLYKDLGEETFRQLIREATQKIEELSRSSGYYAALTDELAGQNVKHDSNITVLNNKLRIKNQGFAVLANLQTKIHTNQTFERLCTITIQEINNTLKMDRTLILIREGESYKPRFWSGFTAEASQGLEGFSLHHDTRWMEDGFLLANRKGGKSEAAQNIKEHISLLFFIGVPIKEEGETVGLLLSGRMKEVNPFYPPLEIGDIDTFLAISGFLSSTNQLNRQKENLEKLNRTLEQKVLERTAELSEALKQLEVKNLLIKKIFGRYMSNEVVEQILEAPEGLELGGDTLKVSVMFTDLRGFSAISESLPPETVVDMLNLYLKEMTRVIFSYSGTINEFMGDGVLILFGAPTTRSDDADRAVACAIEMQLAMSKVNEVNRQHGYPNLEMGIGIHSGSVIAGNIGSDMRTKYTVIGSNVNLAARVESFTVGGQILVTQATVDAVSAGLKITGEFNSSFKGIKDSVRMYEIEGIEEPFKLFLPEKILAFHNVAQPLDIHFEALSGKTSSGKFEQGKITALADKYCLLSIQVELEIRSNIKLFLLTHQSPDEAVYAKIMKRREDGIYEINLTFIPMGLYSVFTSVGNERLE